MMISIALVMLIMLMFAAIFDMVANLMSAQKGIAENDQKARSITILMKEDLEHRTFRRVVPFFPGQKTSGKPGPFYTPGERRGYFSISENDPLDPTDDVLAFTAQFDVPISAHALSLDFNTPNQPEFDDGFYGNHSGSSRTVEIVYFLRYGNLYRRVLLVRESYDDSGPLHTDLKPLAPPSPGPGPPPPSPTANFNEFWRNFDYSAFRKFSGITSSGLVFHDAGTALSNVHPAGNVDTDFGFPVSLGIPHLRFGHSLNRGDGTPREFIGPNDTLPFFGRFTAQETAHSAFNYPGENSDPHAANFNLSLNNSGIVSLFGNQIFRRGEDILLSNVHEFDVKVWDGYEEKDFNLNGVLENEDGNRNGVLDPGEDKGQNGFPPNGLLDVEDINYDGRFDSVLDFVNLGHNRTASTGASIGYYNQTVFPHQQRGPYGLRNRAYGNRYDTWHPFDDTSNNPINFGIPPYRPLHPFNGNDRVPGTFQNDDLTTPLDDVAERGWLGSDDEVPLKAIQITIRFFDVPSDQMRQLTLIHSLVD